MADCLCSSCARPMGAGRMGPVLFAACQSCALIWLRRDGLTGLLGGGSQVLWRLAEGLRAAAVRPRSVPAGGPCPTCRAPLQGVQYPSMPGLELQACGTCRAFALDANLLTQIAARLTDTSQAEVALPPSMGKWRAPTAPEARGKTRPTGAGKAAEGDGTCAGCGQPNSPDAAVCWACGRLLKGAVRGVCPRCSGRFHRLDSEGVEVGVCDGCGGSWLEDGRLGALMMQDWETQDRLLREAAKVRTGRIRKLEHTLFCPDCKLLMFPTPMGMLTKKPVDTCPQCRSAFLDEGALAEILYSRRG